MKNESTDYQSYFSPSNVSVDNQIYSSSLNVSADEDNFGAYASLTAGEVIALTVLSSGISVIGTISNILLILAVLLNRQLRQTCTAILLINLSSFDLIICVVYVPMFIYDVNYGSGALSETVRRRIRFGLFIGSLNGELSVTLGRFISICFPYWYLAWTTNIRMSAVLSLSWFVAIVLTLLSLLTDPSRYSFLYITVILILIVSFHLVMYVVARREAEKIASQFPPECQKFPLWNKSAKTVAMVVAASFLCWAPIAILAAVASPSSPIFRRYLKITLAFTSLTAVVDPFVYCWRLSDFRSALYACLQKPRRILCQNVNWFHSGCKLPLYYNPRRQSWDKLFYTKYFIT